MLSLTREERQGEALGKALRLWGESGVMKKSGLKVATLISTPNPVSQVLW